MSMLVRLKPYNPRRGYVTQRYMVRGAMFVVHRGWYEVADEFAEYLKTLNQIDGDIESPKLFDVMSREDAEKLVEHERLADQRGSADSARRVDMRTSTVTTRDSSRTQPTPPPTQESAEMIDPDPDGEEVIEGDDENSAAREVGKLEPTASEKTKPKSRGRAR